MTLALLDLLVVNYIEFLLPFTCILNPVIIWLMDSALFFIIPCHLTFGRSFSDILDGPFAGRDFLFLKESL
jgi:hypothetical protein